MSTPVPEWLVPGAIIKLPLYGTRKGLYYRVYDVKPSITCRSGWHMRVQRLSPPFFKRLQSLDIGHAVPADISGHVPLAVEYKLHVTHGSPFRWEVTCEEASYGAARVVVKGEAELLGDALEQGAAALETESRRTEPPAETTPKSPTPTNEEP